MPERQVGLLTITKLRHVALVQRGANPLAQISLVKSADVIPGSPTPARKDEPVTQSTAYQELEAKAIEIKKSKPSLSNEQAMDRAYDQNSDLVAKHRDHDPDLPDTFEKSGPLVVGGDEAAKLAARIEALADKLARERNVTKSVGYDLVERDPEGLRLMSEYRKALRDDEGAEAFAKSAAFIGG